MPSLGFSVDNKSPPPRRRVSAIRLDIIEDRRNDAGFVVSMFVLGLAVLALGAYHDQIRALLGRFFGF
jgi:hypothetical protein